MPETKEIATFDMSEIALYEEQGDKFLVTPQAEDILARWIAFKKRVQEVDDMIKAKYNSQMQKDNILKIEGESVKVLRMSFGEKFEVLDQEMALSMGFAVKEERVKANGKEIERYIKDTGELPECIKLKERSMNASIREVNS